MTLDWTVHGALALIVALAQAGMAALVLALRPDRAANRALAAMLLLEGAALFWGAGIAALSPDAGAIGAARAVAALLFLLIPLVELRFLAALDVPLTRPLRHRAVLAASVILGAALVVAFYARRAWFLVPAASWEASLGPVQLAYSALAALLHVYALVAALAAWRRARTPLAKRQAAWFATSFGARNVGFVVIVALVLVGVPDVTHYAFQVLALAYVPLMAYGIAIAQMMDIDLRIKVGLRRGTIAAVFLVVFVGVAEVAQNYLSNEYGYAAGGAAAGILLLGIAPLQRIAERVGNAAMPGVQETPEYLSYRKFEVYRAALEGALDNGEITQRERTVLARLRDSLGLDVAVAVEMERELAAKRAVPT